MLQMIRFFTQQDAIEQYNMPPSIAAKVFPSLRSFPDSCGNPVYADEDLDPAVLKHIRPNGRVGRKTTTEKYGQLAAKIKKQGRSWSETAKAVNEKYGTNYNATSIRRCVQRVNDRQLAPKTDEKN
jgi:hypothetical protein